jgi:hypothetical protein
MHYEFNLVSEAANGISSPCPFLQINAYNSSHAESPARTMPSIVLFCRPKSEGSLTARSKTNKMRIMVCRGRRENPLSPPPPNEFRMIKSAAKTSHPEHVKDRRSQADGDRLMAKSLRRRIIRRSSERLDGRPSPGRKA